VVTMVYIEHKIELTKVAYFLNISHNTGCAIAQAARCQFLTMETQVQSLVTSCEICGGQSGTGVGFSLSSLVFPC
jgi:hypothetical protein